MVQSRTGSGKTAAFGIPFANGIVNGEDKFVQAIVLLPTRELALQVAAELAKICAVPADHGRPGLRRRADGPAGRAAARGRPDRVRHAGPRARPPAPRHAAPRSRALRRARRVRRDAVDGLPGGHRGDPREDADRAPDAAVLGDGARGDPAPGAAVPAHARVHQAVGRLHRRPRDPARLLFDPRHPARGGAAAHPRLRGPEVGHHLLQHARGDRPGRRVPARQGPRRRGDLVGPDAERSRARARPHARGRHQVPGRDRRRGARHRHREPVARLQLHVPRVARDLHPPHRPHRPRRPQGDRDLAHRPDRGRVVLLPEAALQDQTGGALAAVGGGDPIAPRGRAGAGAARGRWTAIRAPSGGRSRGGWSAPSTASGWWRRCSRIRTRAWKGCRSSPSRGLRPRPRSPTMCSRAPRPRSRASASARAVAGTATAVVATATATGRVSAGAIEGRAIADGRGSGTARASAIGIASAAGAQVRGRVQVRAPGAGSGRGSGAGAGPGPARVRVRRRVRGQRRVRVPVRVRRAGSGDERHGRRHERRPPPPLRNDQPPAEREFWEVWSEERRAGRRRRRTAARGARAGPAPFETTSPGIGTGGDRGANARASRAATRLPATWPACT